jgi:hypothetical protein
MPSRPLSADTQAVVKLFTRLDNEAIDVARDRTDMPTAVARLARSWYRPRAELCDEVMARIDRRAVKPAGVPAAASAGGPATWPGRCYALLTKPATRAVVKPFTRLDNEAIDIARGRTEMPAAMPRLMQLVPPARIDPVGEARVRFGRGDLSLTLDWLPVHQVHQLAHRGEVRAPWVFPFRDLSRPRSCFPRIRGSEIIRLGAHHIQGTLPSPHPAAASHRQTNNS